MIKQYSFFLLSSLLYINCVSHGMEKKSTLEDAWKLVSEYHEVIDEYKNNSLLTQDLINALEHEIKKLANDKGLIEQASAAQAQQLKNILDGKEIAENSGKAYKKQELRKKYQEACQQQILAEEQSIALKEQLQNQALDTENKVKDLTNTFDQIKKEYTSLSNEKEQLLGKISSLEHDKKILTKEVKRLQPYSLKTKALIAAGVAAGIWTAIEVYDTYQKLSVHEKWNSANSLKKAKLIAAHTKRAMASRPRQAFNFIKEKIQK